MAFILLLEIILLDLFSFKKHNYYSTNICLLMHVNRRLSLKTGNINNERRIKFMPQAMDRK